MRQPKDYNKGKIYVLRNHTNDKVYVGSTTSPLYKRFSYHKCSMNAKQKQNYKIYGAMRKIGFDNFYIELIEDYPCENIDQLEAREGHWQRELNSYNNGYNGKIQGRTPKEYREEHKEHIREWMKQYREDNKETIRKQIKEYREKNKEKIRNQIQEYREKNKEKLYEKVVCECGSEVSRQHLKRHYKSIKHQDYMNHHK